MIQSMTGFGTATANDEGFYVSIELKSVNNRFFKLSLRMSEGYAALEQAIEPFVRKKIGRGTVNASIRIRRNKKLSDNKIVEPVLQAYFEQLLDIGAKLDLAGENQHPRLDQLLLLPGVVTAENELNIEEKDQLAGLIQAALEAALEQLDGMRQAEGESMARDLVDNIVSLRASVAKIETMAPNVALQYAQRLTERIGKIMSEQNLTLNQADLVREIALFTDRCDISEEIVRFRSHLEQFESAMRAKESCGKKLDFLTQELFRETNTMGSKANDAEITKQVVEMKTVIERIREMIQNIE